MLVEVEGLVDGRVGGGRAEGDVSSGRNWDVASGV